MLIPSGLSTNKYEQPLWNYLLDQEAVVNLFDFTNEDGSFPAIDSRTKFAILGLRKTRSKRFRVGCWLRKTAEITDTYRVVELSAADLDVLSPGTRALPQFRLAKDLELLRAAYRRCPRFGEATGWAHQLRLMFSSSDVAFSPIEHARTSEFGWLSSNRKLAPDGTTYVPVYEGKMVGLYDHRQADIYLNPNNPARQAQERPLPVAEKDNPLRFAIPQHWLPESLVRARRTMSAQGDWTIAFCDVTSSLNERTCIPTVLPLAGLTRSMPAIYLTSHSARDAAILMGVLSSMCLDYFARLSVSTNHLTQGIMDSLPVPELGECNKLAESLFQCDWLVVRTVELVYTAWDVSPFAMDCGFDISPFRWNEDRRFAIRCELDAAFFHLYLPADADGRWQPPAGETPEQLDVLTKHFPTPRDAVAYVMDQFPVVRKKDKAAHGRYRTKDQILEVYDALQAVRRTGRPYVSPLDPPPGDPRGAHSR